jgi:hypothetical protein
MTDKQQKQPNNPQPNRRDIQQDRSQNGRVAEDQKPQYIESVQPPRPQPGDDKKK